MLDREELFGEGSGKASNSLAKVIPGSNLQALQVMLGGLSMTFL